MVTRPILARALGQIFALVDVEHSQSGCTGHGVAAIRPAERARRWRVHDFRAPDNSTDRQASTHRFRDEYQVWLNTVVVDREHLTGATEARLNFVGHKEDTMLLAKPLERL